VERVRTEIFVDGSRTATIWSTLRPSGRKHSCRVIDVPVILHRHFNTTVRRVPSDDVAGGEAAAAVVVVVSVVVGVSSS
jgi:hypothetical protein